ncbi:hypothetical protein HDR61_03105 [bacterium]|nr:hypothetical protein [bacterium]
MNKNKKVICKNCGTEWSLEEKRKIPKQFKVTMCLSFALFAVFMFAAMYYWVYFFVVMPAIFPFFFDGPSTILGILCIICLTIFSMCGSIANNYKYICPACGCMRPVPADSPLGHKIRDNS